MGATHGALARVDAAVAPAQARMADCAAGSAAGPAVCLRVIVPPMIPVRSAGPLQGLVVTEELVLPGPAQASATGYDLLLRGEDASRVRLVRDANVRGRRGCTALRPANAIEVLVEGASVTVALLRAPAPLLPDSLVPLRSHGFDSLLLHERLSPNLAPLSHVVQGCACHGHRGSRSSM